MKIPPTGPAPDPQERMPAIDRDSRWSNIHHALNRMEGRISRDPARGMDLSDCQIVRSYVQELEADTAALRAQLVSSQKEAKVLRLEKALKTAGERPGFDAQLNLAKKWTDEQQVLIDRADKAESALTAKDQHIKSNHLGLEVLGAQVNELLNQKAKAEAALTALRAERDALVKDKVDIQNIASRYERLIADLRMELAEARARLALPPQAQEPEK